jgi:hypothetical protein
VRLGMENQFFVEAKSLILSMVKRSVELRWRKRGKVSHGGFCWACGVLLGCCQWWKRYCEILAPRISLNHSGKVRGDHRSERWE